MSVAQPNAAEILKADVAGPDVSRRRRWWLTAAVAGGASLAFAALLSHLLAEIELAAVASALRSMTATGFAVSLLWTALSYAALIGYDAIALRLAAPTRDVGPARIALGSFTSYAIGQTLGFPLLTAAAVRWRIYRVAGVTPAELAKVTLIAGATLWLGMAAVLGLGLALGAGGIDLSERLPSGLDRALGIGLLGALAAITIWAGLGHRSLGRGALSIQLPGARQLLLQIGFGIVDIGAAAAALWVLLPDSTTVTLPAFAAIFAVAIIGAVASNLPVGLGAFEAAVLLGLPNDPPAGLLAALLAWRISYALVPFALATLLLLGHEAHQHRAALAAAVSRTGRMAAPFIPGLLAAVTFLGGIVLLTSGSTPAGVGRLAALKPFVPLPFVELSHLIGSVAGVVLLVVAHGLSRRLARAWVAAVAIVAAGIIVSLLKGGDWQEALVLLAVLGFLLGFRDRFYRRAGLLEHRPPAPWLAAILGALAACVWIGLLSYREVAYSNDLWWTITWEGDASRFLRASLAASIAAIGIAAYGYVTRGGPRTLPKPPDAALLRPAIARSRRASAHLALTGDKLFLHHPTEPAFIMYGVSGNSWIAMGDPTGAPEHAMPLLWRFLELVDEHDGWPVLYQVSPAFLPACLDAGLALVKLGEEARVDLAAFTIEGSAGGVWRRTLGRGERDGFTLELVSGAEVKEWLAQLRPVSDAWLTMKNVAEKRFSVGRWSASYLAHGELAVVSQAGTPIAFANLWSGADHDELSIDLMRHVPGAPRVMDYLFVALMLEGKKRGYRWFNLGMAPLAGMTDHRLAPAWHKTAAFLAHHGERFYGFAGLRTYKAKFHPVWEPRYLAYPGGWTLPRVLYDATRLISGGALRTVRR